MPVGRKAQGERRWIGLEWIWIIYNLDTFKHTQHQHTYHTPLAFSLPYTFLHSLNSIPVQTKFNIFLSAFHSFHWAFVDWTELRTVVLFVNGTNGGGSVRRAVTVACFRTITRGVLKNLNGGGSLLPAAEAVNVVVDCCRVAEISGGGGACAGIDCGNIVQNNGGSSGAGAAVSVVVIVGRCCSAASKP